MIRIPEGVRRDVLQVCRRLYERRLVAGTDGNVSVRIAADRIVATPTGASKGFLEAGDLVVCDLTGRQLEGKRRLTTEIKIHLAAYRVRDDVCAVVHAHPPVATAFAVAGLSPSEKLMPEAYIAVGEVALAPYATPSTDDLAEKIRPALEGHDAILLANHGAMTLGRELLSAYHRMEALEQLCTISLLARQLGGARSLSAAELAQLDAIRSVYGGAATNVPCYQCGWSPQETARLAARDDAERRDGDDRPPGEPVPPAAYVEPDVHWPGNPPVWERPGRPGSRAEAQVRDLVRRALRSERRE